MSAKVIPGPRSAELNGLNWQVHVDPLTLSITSLPPTFALLADADVVPDVAGVEVVVFELLPQELSRKHIAGNTVSHRKRFIKTLRSTHCPGHRRVPNYDHLERT